MGNPEQPKDYIKDLTSQELQDRFDQLKNDSESTNH